MKYKLQTEVPTQGSFLAINTLSNNPLDATPYSITKDGGLLQYNEDAGGWFAVKGFSIPNCEFLVLGDEA